MKYVKFNKNHFRGIIIQIMNIKKKKKKKQGRAIST